MRYWEPKPPPLAPTEPPKRVGGAGPKTRPGPQSSAPKTDPRLTTRGTTPAPEPKNKRKIELIEYPEDAALVDHKGRTKPIYKPQSPRPQAWRPGHGARLLMGLVPGVRLLALYSFKLGLLYVIPALITLLLGIFLLVYWSTNTDHLALLQGQPQWLLVPAAGIWASTWVYEILRAAAALEERTKGPRLPRILAALVLPGIVTLLGAPAIVSLYPPLVEGVFFAGIVLTLGGLPGVVWCSLDAGIRPESQQQKFRWGMLGVALIAAATVALLLAGGQLFPGWVQAARSHGFQLLPNLLQ